MATTDLEVLDRRVRRAATVTPTDELFEQPPPSACVLRPSGPPAPPTHRAFRAGATGSPAPRKRSSARVEVAVVTQGNKRLTVRQQEPRNPFEMLRPLLVVSKGALEHAQDEDRLLLQWVQDSAFRFFPLVEHAEFGLVPHPLDLATNKVLALVGRLEVRDWVDVIETSERLQSFGYLAWAAVGKDPGFTPHALIEHAARSRRYSAMEVATLSFDGPPPDAADLSRRWHHIVDQARQLVSLLPVDAVGHVVLHRAGGLFTGTPAELREALDEDRVIFRGGSVRATLPHIVG